MGNTGATILKAVLKSYPCNLSGKPISNLAQQTFSLSNPYILDNLPQALNKDLAVFEGKKLRTVCNILDNPESLNILNRYKSFCSKAQAGFSKPELASLYKKAFPNTKVPSDANLDAFVLLHDINPKIGCQFDAHGIAKSGITDQLKQLNNLLSKGIDKTRRFDTAPLTCENPEGAGAALGTAGGHAYWDGSFILVSGKGKKLTENGIEHVIVNDAYYSIFDDLVKKFPKVNFIRADKAAEFFNKI